MKIDSFLKKSGIKKIYCFHTDHFEPTSLSHDSIVSNNIIKKFIAQTKKYDHSRRMSLFYRPTFKVLRADDKIEDLVLGENPRIYQADGDLVVFLEDALTLKSKKIAYRTIANISS